MEIIKNQKNKYILRIDRGEEVIEQLKYFCEENDIKAAFFNGIGATDEVDLSWYDVDEKKYETKHLDKKMEIVNLTGDIAEHEEKMIIHVHGIFANRDMTTQAGHIDKLVVSATCEIVLETFEGKIEREYDPKTGLNLFKKSV